MIFRKPVFWGAFLGFFLFCGFLSLRLYPIAFPIVDLKIEMNRTDALNRAATFATQNQWGPDGFSQSTSFELDNETQTFVELAAGGSQGFRDLLKNKLYEPYQWVIRHFAEGKANETLIRFTPQGGFYGFQEVLPEDHPGAALSTSKALALAEAAAKSLGNAPLSDFRLIEKSSETKRSKRIDHTFVYERPNQKIGDGHYRLRLVISGDRLTELTYFIKIPDAFRRSYAEMRSANETITTFSTIVMIILYFVIGCGVGVFLLSRQRWILWKQPLFWGCLVAFFQVLERLNQLPLLWMNYDTAVSSSGFILHHLTSLVAGFLAECFMLTISFIAAESLTRKAFPHHPQFWCLWKTGNANSVAVLGRTLGGYLSVTLFFLLVIVTYLIGTRYFGWWNPSDALFQPDSLASYFPWFTSIANSLHAGFWEESLFRAVPLAGAALIGEHFGRRRTWITAGFIVQALIFATAHANYPAQPSYARVLELLLPSSFFGAVYLLFGLLPGIILHFTFDAVSFAIPIFAANTPRIWVDRFFVIFFALAPLWIVLAARVRSGKWSQLKPSELNKAWSPSKHKEPFPESKPAHTQTLRLPKTSVLVGLGATAALGIAIWNHYVVRPDYLEPLNIGRKRAIQVASEALKNRGARLGSEWEPLTWMISQADDGDEFIWQTEGTKRYKSLVGTYLTPPAWVVRFVRFDTNAAERAEEFQVLIAKNGDVLRIRHDLPEARQGATLEEEEARKTALASVLKDGKIITAHIKDVSHTAFKLPARKDWLFVFSDASQVFKSGEARIAVRIAGDEVVSMRPFIFIPEDWARKERNRENVLQIIRMCSILFVVLVLGTGVVVSVLQWSRKKFETRTFASVFSFLFVIEVLNVANSLPLRFAGLSTAQPKLNQTLTSIGFSLVKILSFSASSALIAGYLHYKSRVNRPLQPKVAGVLGYSTGALVTVLVAAVFHFMPSPGPTWGKVQGLDTYFPIISDLDLVVSYTGLTLLFSLLAVFLETLTAHWTRRHGMAVLVICLSSLALSGLLAETAPIWITTGLALSTCLALVYPFLFRYHLGLIPLATGSLFILSEWRQIKLYPYPDVGLSVLVGITFFVCVSWLWSRETQRMP